MNTTQTAITTILTALLAVATGYLTKGQAQTTRVALRAHERLDELPGGDLQPPAPSPASEELDGELLAELRRAAPAAVAIAERTLAIAASTSSETPAPATR